MYSCSLEVSSYPVVSMCQSATKKKHSYWYWRSTQLRNAPW